MQGGMMIRCADLLFNFPRAKFADENNIHAQVAHIQTEADEAFRELNTDQRALAMEIMDCLHSCETALRMLEDEGLRISEIMTAVYEKNEARGYYE